MSERTWNSLQLPLPLQHIAAQTTATLHHTASYRNTLQHTAPHCCGSARASGQQSPGFTTNCNTLQPTATHSITLQHTATHCTTLHHTAPHYTTLHHTAPHCITLHHTAPHCTTLHHTAPHCDTSHHTAPHCRSHGPLPPWSFQVRNTTVMRCVAMCCRVVQCGAVVQCGSVWFSVVQCGSVWCSAVHTNCCHLVYFGPCGFTSLP